MKEIPVVIPQWTLPVGSIVKIAGLPYELLFETCVEGYGKPDLELKVTTDVDAAMRISPNARWADAQPTKQSALNPTSNAATGLAADQAVLSGLKNDG